MRTCHIPLAVGRNEAGHTQQVGARCMNVCTTPPHTHTRCQKLTHQNVKLKIFGLQDRVLEHKKGLVTLIYKVIKNSNDGHACKKHK